MTTKDIKRKLEKIYSERKKWNGAKGLFDKTSVNKRTFILIAQQILSQMLIAKQMRNLHDEVLFCEIFCMLEDKKVIRGIMRT